MKTTEELLQMLNKKVVVVCVVATGAALWWFRPGRKKYNMPPSPYWTLPLVGNLIQLMRLKKSVYETFTDLPKDYKVFTIYAGLMPVIVLNHIDVALEPMVTKMNDFAGKPKSEAGMMVSMGGKNIIFGEYGPVWKFHRMILTKALKKRAHPKILEELIHNSVRKAIDEIEKRGDVPIDIRPMITLIFFNMTCGLAYSKEYEFDDPQFRKYVNLAGDFLEAVGNGLPGDFHPWLHYLPSARYNRAKELNDGYLAFVRERHEECKENFNASHPKNVADCMLQYQKEAIDENRETRHALTNIHVMLTTSDLFGAGIGTMTTSVVQFVAHMIQNPDIQERVHDEVEAAVGSAQMLKLKHRPQLPFTEACLCETLRIGTIAPLGNPLLTTCDTSVAGFDIPKDTIVLVNVWAIHRNPEVWSDPHSFKPDRFLVEDGGLGHKPPSYMPFSMGRRVCLGRTLALSSLMLVIPELVRHFKFRSPSGIEVRLEYDKDALARIPKSYKCLMQSRV